MAEATAAVTASSNAWPVHQRRNVAVRLESITKTYRGAASPAVNNVTLDVPDGQFVTLLGPSGCGKTTTLRIVAGLENADSGKVFFGDKPIVDTSRRLHVRPDRRNVGMVFQAYAIWPHMTVAQNVAFPLHAHKYPRKDIRKRVSETLELVGLGGLEDRQAPLLSGGQQQRVALARAIVTEPHILLLDEPFSNLDVKLREQMRLEMKLLQERVEVAVLFVTHDQTEALALSDKIAIMDGGVVQQQGTPAELYQQPSTKFTRDFIGNTLLFTGTVTETITSGTFRTSVTTAGSCVIAGRAYGDAAIATGEDVQIAVRPEDIEIVPADGATRPANALEGTLVTALFMGDRFDYQVDVAGQGRRVVPGHLSVPFERGMSVFLTLNGEGHTIWSR
ncbi:MAG TPA: ABC transporter ATP-binding protein [Micromonosporaceae bacterium]|nr:ABC transporter ATP-binding protein [Micromonosporaceae bacterium]